MTDTARCECPAPANARLVHRDDGDPWWRCDTCGHPVDWTATPPDEQLTVRFRLRRPEP
jgi:hypothetical protein